LGRVAHSKAALGLAGKPAVLPTIGQRAAGYPGTSPVAAPQVARAPAETFLAGKALMKVMQLGGNPTKPER